MVSEFVDLGGVGVTKADWEAVDGCGSVGCVGRAGTAAGGGCVPTVPCSGRGPNKAAVASEGRSGSVRESTYPAMGVGCVPVTVVGCVPATVAGCVPV